MSGPANFAAKITSGATGTQTLNSNFFVRGIHGGDTWYFGFFWQATRVSGVDNETITASVDWYDSSATLISTTNSPAITVNATQAWAYTESAHAAPTNAVSAKVRFTITCGGASFEHDVYITKTRFSKTQSGATLGADWASNITSRPANLVALVGTEAINNQAILNSIAADQVLSASEKVTALIKLHADLEARYTDLKNRATAVSVSTTALDSARTDWLALLNAYSPTWNNTALDTTIYTPALGDTAFPGGQWSGTATTAANDIYTTLTDGDAVNTAQYGHSSVLLSGISNKWVSGSGYLFGFGVLVKKDSTGRATRFPVFRILFEDASNAATINADIALDTSTGEFNLSGTYNGGGVLDLGTDWFAWVSAVSTTLSTQIIPLIYPACGASSTWVYTGATTGNINARAPVIGNGSWGQLGRSMLVGKLNAYSGQMTTLAKNISLTDSQLSNYVDGPTTANITYDSTGATLQGTYDLNFYLRSGTAGTIVTSGVTMTYTVISGTVNGFNAASGAQTLTVTSGIGDLSVTAMTSDTAQIKVSVTSSGIVRTYFCSLTRVLAAAASSSGTGGGTSASQTSGFTGISSAYGTYAVISNTLNFTTGSAQTSVSVQLNINPHMAKSADNWGPWDVLYKVQRLISGTWTDQATVQHSNPDPFIDSTDGITMSTSGQMSATVSVTGLVASTAYSFRILCCLAAVDGTTTFAYPTNGASLSQIVPSGGGVFIS